MTSAVYSLYEIDPVTGIEIHIATYLTEQEAINYLEYNRAGCSDGRYFWISEESYDRSN